MHHLEKNYPGPGFFKDNTELCFDEEGLLTSRQHPRKPFSGTADEFYPPEGGKSQTKTSVTYKKGKKDGLAQSFYQDGQLHEQGYYKEDELDGPWQINQRVISRQISGDAPYFSKVPNFFFITLNDQPPIKGNAIQLLQLQRNYKQGKKHGLWEEYMVNDHREYPFYGHHGGQLDLIRENYKDGKKHGLCEWFNENYDLLQRGYFKEGEVDGLWERFRSNGHLYYSKNYKEGDLDGAWENFYENGQLESKRIYKNGDLDGSWEHFYENGQLKSKINDLGDWEDFYENGQLKGKRTYDYKGTGHELNEQFNKKGGLISGQVWKKKDLKISGGHFDPLWKSRILASWYFDGNGHLMSVEEMNNGLTLRWNQSFACLTGDDVVVSRSHLFPQNVIKQLHQFPFELNHEPDAHILASEIDDWFFDEMAF